MTIGEIREFNIDGKYIRVEYLGEKLYAVNDVLVWVDLNEGYDFFNSKHLAYFSELRSHPYFPYPGPENDSVIGISAGAINHDKFITSYWDLTTFADAVQSRAVNALRHYRQIANLR